jgi:hypothetical protein
MKHIKKIEKFPMDKKAGIRETREFDLGRFSEEEGRGADDWGWENSVQYPEDENELINLDDQYYIDDEDEEEFEDDEIERRIWGDEIVEKKGGSHKEMSYEDSGLKNPKKADLDKSGKISEYERRRGKAIEKAIEEKEKEKISESGGRIKKFTNFKK